MMHGGPSSQSSSMGPGGVELVAKPALPPALDCGCRGGNGGTPFYFMQWWGALSLSHCALLEIFGSCHFSQNRDAWR